MVSLKQFGRISRQYSVPGFFFVLGGLITGYSAIVSFQVAYRSVNPDIGYSATPVSGSAMIVVLFAVGLYLLFSSISVVIHSSKKHKTNPENL